MTSSCSTYRIASSAFTLIEILVVLVILGITVGFVTITMSYHQSHRETIAIAEQLAARFRAAEVRAILQTTLLGVDVSPQKYAFYRQSWDIDNQQGHWDPLPNTGSLSSVTWPPTLQVKLHFKPHTGHPNILFSPNGDITPFQITLRFRNKASLCSIVGEANGVIRIV